MQLLIAVINQEEKLDEILSGLVELGVTGATDHQQRGDGARPLARHPHLRGPGDARLPLPPAEPDALQRDPRGREGGRGDRGCCRRSAAASTTRRPGSSSPCPCCAWWGWRRSWGGRDPARAPARTVSAAEPVAGCGCASSSSAPRLGDPAANLERIVDAQADAARERVDLLVTPELSLTGYDLRDRTHAVAAAPRAATPSPTLAAGPDVVLGVVERDAGLRALQRRRPPARAAASCTAHRKVYLPTYGMFDEGRYFGAGDRRPRLRRRGRLARWGCWSARTCGTPPWRTSWPWTARTCCWCRPRRAGGAPGRAGGERGRFASWPAWEHLACAAARRLRHLRGGGQPRRRRGVGGLLRAAR